MTMAERLFHLKRVSGGDWALALSTMFLVAEFLMPWHVNLHPRMVVKAIGHPPVVPLPQRPDTRVIDEKPLFATSRQPWKPPPAPQPPVMSATALPAAPEPAGYRLEGTTLSPRGDIALVRSQARATTIRLQLNQVLDGWALVAIKPESLEFHNGSRVFRLAFDQPARRSVPPYPVGASPVPRGKPILSAPR